MFTVEALIVARDFQGAVEAIRGFRADHPDWEHRYGGLFDSLLAVAFFGLRDDTSAMIFWNNFIGRATLRADNLLAVANRFAELGAVEQARRTLARAVELDALNQAALTRLVELDVEMNAGDDLATHMRRLIRMRRPSPDIMRVAQLKLGSDLFLFSKECPAALEVVRVALERVSESDRRL